MNLNQLWRGRSWGFECWRPQGSLEASPFKLNLDVALQDNKWGLEVVVRDVEGDVIMAAGECRHGGENTEEAEATAILFGLQLAFDAGFRSLRWSQIAPK